jgi:hypothetical protein
MMMMMSSIGGERALEKDARARALSISLSHAHRRSSQLAEKGHLREKNGHLRERRVNKGNWRNGGPSTLNPKP